MAKIDMTTEALYKLIYTLAGQSKTDAEVEAACYGKSVVEITSELTAAISAGTIVISENPDTIRTKVVELGTALGVTMTGFTGSTIAGAVEYIADHYTAPVVPVMAITETDGTLDKTWNEIHTAMAAGKFCYIYRIENTTGAVSPIAIASDNDNTYSITAMNCEVQEVYVATTADDYPVFTD